MYVCVRVCAGPRIAGIASSSMFNANFVKPSSSEDEMSGACRSLTNKRACADAHCKSNCLYATCRRVQQRRDASARLDSTVRVHTDTNSETVCEMMCAPFRSYTKYNACANKSQQTLQPVGRIDCALIEMCVSAINRCDLCTVLTCHMLAIGIV